MSFSEPSTSIVGNYYPRLYVLLPLLAYIPAGDLVPHTQNVRQHSNSCVAS